MSAALCLAAPPSHAASDAPGAEGAVLAAERALTEAMHGRDAEALDRLLAPDYVLRGAPDVDRETWLRNALRLCWGERSDIADFAVRENGTMAIASFTLTFHVDPATCKTATLRSLITDVWTREEGGWRLLVRHSGPPPEGLAGQFGAVPEAPPAWDLGGELSLVATGGNASTRTVGLGSDVTHRSRAGLTRATLAYVTSEAEEVTSARSLAAQARHGFRIRDRLELFGRGSYFRDRFAGIGRRTSAEGGLSLDAPMPPGQALKVEGSFGFTTERRLDATRLDFATATAALAYTWTLGGRGQLAQDVALIADLEAGRNWRGTSVTALRVTVSRLLSLKVSHGIEYRNAPVAGFGRTDTRTAAALVVSIQTR